MDGFIGHYKLLAWWNELDLDTRERIELAFEDLSRQHQLPEILSSSELDAVLEESNDSPPPTAPPTLTTGDVSYSSAPAATFLLMLAHQRQARGDTAAASLLIEKAATMDAARKAP